MSVVKVLSGHYSPETSYITENYPYGFTLKCRCRFWLEIHPKKGTRLWTQTTNPKMSGEVWNKPKASTYAAIAGALYLDDEGHCHWAQLSQYDASKARDFLSVYGEGLTEDQRKDCEAFADAYDRYEAAKSTKCD